MCIKFYITDYNMEEEYIFDTLEDVEEFFSELKEDGITLPEDFRVIKGEEIEIC